MQTLQLAYENYDRDTECVQLQVPDSTTELEPELPTSNVTEKNKSKITQTNPPLSPKAEKHKNVNPTSVNNNVPGNIKQFLKLHILRRYVKLSA